MILFVFEGRVTEPRIFESLNKLYFSQEEIKVVCYGSHLPSLYSKLKTHEYDLFRCLPLKENGISVPEGKRTDTLFSQIFLFFDYDFQHRAGTDYVNDVLKEMLEFFNDETENGKLYINYPMVESLKYTKEMPDDDYYRYAASRENCKKFKDMAEKFAYAKAKGYRFLDLSDTSEPEVRNNWELLKDQNLKKANYLVCDKIDFPKSKDEINQNKIFNAQKAKYVIPSESVSILNSFPIFLYDYFK